MYAVNMHWRMEEEMSRKKIYIKNAKLDSFKKSKRSSKWKGRSKGVERSQMSNNETYSGVLPAADRWTVVGV